MNIIIKTEKVIDRGEQKRKMLEIHALKKSELPTAYINNSEFERVYQDCLSLQSPESTDGDLYFTTLYDEEVFQVKLDYIKRAAKNLHDVNKRLAKENKNWKGEETFVI